VQDVECRVQGFRGFVFLFEVQGLGIGVGRKGAKEACRAVTSVGHTCRDVASIGHTW